MAEVRGLWIPIVLVVIVMAIIGTFVYFSLSAPAPDNKVLLMSVQNPENSNGTYSLTVSTINNLGTDYDVQVQYFTLHTSDGDVLANLTASQGSPLHLVQGEEQPYDLVFQLPSGTPQTLTYADPSLSVITMTVAPI